MSSRTDRQLLKLSNKKKRQKKSKLYAMIIQFKNYPNLVSRLTKCKKNDYFYWALIREFKCKRTQ